MRRSTLLLGCLLSVVMVLPAEAYTIYLKDGSTLIAKEKYRVEDGKALIVLQNGTQTFIDAAEIDVEKTERVNRSNYGTAFFIDDDGKVIEAPVAPAEKQSLTDIAVTSDASPTLRERVVRPENDVKEKAELPRTAAGNIDLTMIPRTPYHEMDVAAEISRFLRSLGVTDFQVFQGTEPGRVFLEMTANSEATVFRSIEAAADTLIHLRNQFPDQVEELELLLITSNRDRAGQFLIDSENAALLGNESADPAAFFIANVQF